LLTQNDRKKQLEHTPAATSTNLACLFDRIIRQVVRMDLLYPLI